VNFFLAKLADMLHTTIMDANIINPFLEATVNMFKQMFDLEAIHGKPFVLDNLVGHRWEISGTLGLTGDAKGVVVIRMHHLLTTRLLEKSGISVNDEEERREILNGMVGELVNVISGNAIGMIEGKNLDISPPMVIQGENHRISWPRIAPVVCVPFRTASGDFEVAVCMSMK
jgi:chemotaxis protein CheX